ncbi:Oligopeptide transport ATP-binding protein OppD [bacterium HR19]|nr:Oligopeptide transport ATP-binding protein OppD [bacterium HR19]
MQEPILTVKNLSVSFSDKKVVDSVSFSIHRKEVLGIVGESGSGKTMTALSILRLTPPNSKVEGEIIFEGRDILKIPEKEIDKIRGKKISLILQNPHSAFNPVLKVGYQVIEPLIIHNRTPKSEAKKMAVNVFRSVGIPEPEIRFNSYPHELSGGMKQRAVISISILSGAELIIADEPTTALDPTIQSQILKILRNLVDSKSISMIFISHDISVVAWISDKIAVMYGGWIVEMGETYEVLHNPLHPYTKALIASIPHQGEKAKPIPGSPLDIHWKGCRFAKRCPLAQSICFEQTPQDKYINRRKVKCFLV